MGEPDAACQHPQKREQEKPQVDEGWDTRSRVTCPAARASPPHYHESGAGMGEWRRCALVAVVRRPNGSDTNRSTRGDAPHVSPLGSLHTTLQPLPDEIYRFVNRLEQRNRVHVSSVVLVAVSLLRCADGLVVGDVCCECDDGDTESREDVAEPDATGQSVRRGGGGIGSSDRAGGNGDGRRNEHCSCGEDGVLPHDGEVSLTRREGQGERRESTHLSPRFPLRPGVCEQCIRVV